MDYPAFKNLCEQRRSIRYFDEKPVSKEDVLQLLELARQAPSVENLQPWHFHVIWNEELRKKLTESCCYGNFVGGAGVFIVVTANRLAENQAKEVLWNSKELEYSCMAAMQYIILGATAMGLGSCWVSMHHGVAHGVLKLPQTELVVGGLLLGHYKAGEEKSNNEHQRKPLAQLYTFHQ